MVNVGYNIYTFIISSSKLGHIRKRDTCLVGYYYEIAILRFRGYIDYYDFQSQFQDDKGPLVVYLGLV